MKKEPEKLDRVVADARRTRSEREQGYREKALKMYPWICGRCMREFTHANVHELTVHHRDHNHDYNPEDGSNWGSCASIVTTTNTRASLMRRIRTIAPSNAATGRLLRTIHLPGSKTCRKSNVHRHSRKRGTPNG